jgi:hypothetical protein
MNEQEMRSMLEAAGRLLSPRLEASADLRALVRGLGTWLIEEAGKAEPGVGADSARVSAETASASGVTPVDVAKASTAGSGSVRPTVVAIAGEPVKGAGHEGVKKAGGFVPLKIGDTAVQIRVEGNTTELGRARLAAQASETAEASVPETRELDLALIVSRSRLKAQGCRLLIERRGADAAGEAAITERVAEQLKLGKTLRECFLWMWWRERPAPANEIVERIGMCYEAHALATATVEHAIRLAEKFPRAGDLLEPAFQAMATANSALRVSLKDTWLTSPDRDQDDGHLWLRNESWSRQVFVARHMRLDDPASPDMMPEVIEEVTRIAKELTTIEGTSRAVEVEINKIRYHARLLRARDRSEWEEHTAKIGAALERYAAAGNALDDQRVLDILGKEGAERALEGGATGALQRVAMSIVSGVPLEREAGEAAATPMREWSERVKEARTLLEGTAMVVVGGERRRDAEERLIDAFGLTRVEWLSITEHASGAALHAPIARADVSAVVVLIKLAGHLHVDEASAHADAYGKALVRLKAGYNPEQVAEAVLTQAAEKLRESSSPK